MLVSSPRCRGGVCEDVIGISKGAAVMEVISTLGFLFVSGMARRRPAGVRMFRH